MSTESSAILNTTADVRMIALPEHSRDDGAVVVAESFVHVPFSVARMFTLRAPIGALRGNHAHRRCSQFMVCVHGAVDIVCDDGSKRQTFTLDRNDRALLVPPNIWNAVAFRKASSVLVVLCDRHYEDHDYVRDYAEFLKWRQEGYR
jgi:dTDP-4-dehydrorhamnose 3,5-epimerase-like enzyme